MIEPCSVLEELHGLCVTEILLVCMIICTQREANLKLMFLIHCDQRKS
jgi:hypothetical protein